MTREDAGESRGRGSSRTTAFSVSRSDSRSKTRLPVSNSYSTAPKLKTSDRTSVALPCACSGDMYDAVPSTVPAMVRVASSVPCARILASPKSSSLAPLVVIMMLAGFRSRCRIPLACAASRASAICVATCSASLNAIGPCNGVPSMYSMTRYPGPTS